MRKGIILAGGVGSRLSPLTNVISKHMLPVFNKPMIYYPLCTLMLAGIREILIISGPIHTQHFSELLGTGEGWGLQLKYAVQESPDGVAQALVIAEKFLDGDPCALILGDNIFYGNNLRSTLLDAQACEDSATIFVHPVKNPSQYGVVSFDHLGNVISLEEKPKKPRTRYAITGLYFYDNSAVVFAKSLAKSSRGEFEITDLNRHYLERGALNTKVLGRGFSWFDAGTPESLLDASNFIHMIEVRQGLRIACPEETAFRLKFISSEQLGKLAKGEVGTAYGGYLSEVLKSVW